MHYTSPVDAGRVSHDSLLNGTKTDLSGTTNLEWHLNTHAYMPSFFYMKDVTHTAGFKIQNLLMSGFFPDAIGFWQVFEHAARFVM